jgi:outer membrane lipase/esterase
MTALALGVLLPRARASMIDAIYAFGDSLSDVGNISAATSGTIPAAPYVNGQFSNGPVWVQDLAAGLGLTPLTPSRLGGTDYAYGSGETAPESFNTSNVATDILGPTGQLAQYENFLTTTSSTVDPNALYTIWIGSNDLADILANDPTNAAADVATVVQNIDITINELAALGARNFLVLTVPDLGDTPVAASEGAQSALSSLSAGLDATLVNGSGPIPSLAGLASTDGVNLQVLNTYLLLDSIVASPATYGLTNVTNACVNTTPPDQTGPGPLNYTECSDPNSYLFWDYEHPTAAGHQIVADAALAVLAPEPASISLIGVGLIGLALVWLRANGSQRS